MRKTPEAAVKDKIKEILKEWEVEFFMPVAGLYGQRGVSDFICCYGGQFLAIEAKASKREQPTVLQTLFQQRILKARGVTLVIHDENLSLLTSTLRQMAHGGLM